jgi:uncharacterized SAM-binding protein YcdF (DUF218 family)
VSGRLVAVLGYSGKDDHALHPICAKRLARATREARDGDIVLLSGGRRRDSISEAELMARAWSGRDAWLVLDRRARTTFDNACSIATAARALGVDEVVLVTSGWHRRRAAALVRAALRPSGTKLTTAPTDERGSLRAHVRELVCWVLVPVLAAHAARSR